MHCTTGGIITGLLFILPVDLVKSRVYLRFGVSAVLACGGRYRIICRGSKALKFTPPLSAITAAVVGVIVNLAVFFAGHILFPQGWSGTFDSVAALITVLASLALNRYYPCNCRMWSGGMVIFFTTTGITYWCS